MGYIERNLMPGEELVLAPRYHPIRFAPAAAIVLVGLVLIAVSFALGPADVVRGLFLAGAAAVGVGFAAAAWRAVSDSFDEFGVTSLRVLKKTGVLTRVVRQIPIEKVQDVNLHATLWGRWLSYGDVELQSAGSEVPVVFPRIQHPEKMRDVLFQRRLVPASAPLAPPPPAAVPPPRRLTVEERLDELARLKERGLVSEEEYAEKRRALLAEL